MIYGIGIDMVEVARFKEWHTKPPETLARIFSIKEIEYCLSNKAKNAERFAVRYAAKEAFYKALCSWYPEMRIPLSTVCTYVHVVKTDTGVPSLVVDWIHLKIQEQPKVLLSLTHTATSATAIVMITKKELGLN